MVLWVIAVALASAVSVAAQPPDAVAPRPLSRDDVPARVRLDPPAEKATTGAREIVGGVQVTPLAPAVWAGSSVNVVANARQAVFTHGRTQYAAFYDAERFMVLARRTADEDRWETRRTVHRGNVVDAHNSISLAVDGAGILHVAWDHHVNPLNYARSVAADSLELGPRQAMTGEREDRVTYPQFWRLPGGDLLFLYRDGASGRGALVLNRYSVASRAWATVQANLIDGEGVRSPYWDMTVDRRGALHLAWIWRESPDVATNHDICYARSSDEGRTWTRSDGTTGGTPITERSAEYAVRIPQNSNLMNSPVIAADGDGRPYVTTYWSPSPGVPPRFHVLHHDGTRWHVIEGPPRSHAFTLAGGGTKAPPISRAVVLVEPAGRSRRIHLVYRDSAPAAAPGITVATRAWPGDDTWVERQLTTEPVGAWEPAIDPTAWAESHALHMLVQRVVQRDGDDRNAAETPPTPIAVLAWRPADEAAPAPWR